MSENRLLLNNDTVAQFGRVASSSRGKRRGTQASRSCLQCYEAKKACSNERPCKRCVHKNMGDLCTEGNQLARGRPRAHERKSVEISLQKQLDLLFETHSRLQQIPRPDYFQRASNPFFPNMVLQPSIISTVPSSSSLQFDPNLESAVALTNEFSLLDASYTVESTYVPVANNLTENTATITDLDSETSADNSTSWTDNIDSLFNLKDNNSFLNVSSQQTPSLSNAGNNSAPKATLPEELPTVSQEFLASQDVFIESLSDGSGNFRVWHADSNWYQQPQMADTMKEITHIEMRMYRAIKAHVAISRNEVYDSDAFTSALLKEHEVTQLNVQMLDVFDRCVKMQAFRKARLEEYSPILPYQPGFNLPTLSFDNFLQIIDANTRFCSLIGLTFDELLTTIRSVVEVFRPDVATQIAFAFMHIMSTHMVIAFYEMTLTIPTVQGPKPFRMHVACMRTMPGNKLAYCCATFKPCQEHLS